LIIVWHLSVSLSETSLNIYTSALFFASCVVSSVSVTLPWFREVKNSSIL